jgi:HD-like signal output (HDOD) protein/CheY-like chemotaxis protein
MSTTDGLNMNGPELKPVLEPSMKKRILFVDDEPMVLEGLRRVLRPMGAEWDMAFVESGEKALEIMGRLPFDVVIADMRMPGMNGAQLLEEVWKRFPKTVRLILSGHADPDLIMECVGTAHQYLSKPCQAADLKAAISRASGLEQSLRDESLRHLVSRLDRVPSIPSLYAEIVEKLQDPDVGAEEIGEIVLKDLAMTAKILKLVNSAFFGLGREVSNPTDAVTYLGLDTIKSLVLSIHAFSQFDSAKLRGFSIDALWTHSQKTAGLAKEISVLENAGPKVMDEAFVAGLLHDIGKLVLASNFAADYDSVLEAAAGRTAALLEAEEQTFGANHAEIGGYLLGLWGLPVPVVEAIALHHHPGKSPSLAFSPLTSVHAANGFLNLEHGPGKSSLGEELDLKYLGALGLEHRVDVWRGAARAAGS